MLSFTEENYLKALVELTVFDPLQDEVGVNRLAEYLSVKPATVSDMVKKLKVKELVNYQRYGKVSLTNTGRHEGMMVIRRHRLWETFLHTKLDFSWDEVHELAEELEHIHSKKLINRLDEFLEYPKFDPHGDAIPDRDGNILIPFRKKLADVAVGKTWAIIAVKDSQEFLQYMDRIGLAIGDVVEVVSKDDYDGLMTVKFRDQEVILSPKVAERIYVGNAS